MASFFKGTMKNCFIKYILLTLFFSSIFAILPFSPFRQKQSKSIHKQSKAIEGVLTTLRIKKARNIAF